MHVVYMCIGKGCYWLEKTLILIVNTYVCVLAIM